MSDTPNRSRRHFLFNTVKYGAGSLVLAGSGGFAYSYFGNSNLKRAFPQVPQNKVQLPENGKSVIILGGGLAGLQAGSELADRGFKVTILEKSGIPGGKLKAWKDTHFAKKYFPEPGYTREHGLHAVFASYNNLKEFMGRHGIGLNPLSDDESFHYLVSTRVQNKLQISSWPIPFGRFQMMNRGVYTPAADNVHEAAAGKYNAMPALFKLWGFDFMDKEQRRYMDSMTFHDWATKAGVHEQIIKHYFDAYSEMAFFMKSEECSALSLANLYRLAYVPKDSKTSFFQWPPDETVINPIVENIRRRGGEIVYLSEVTGLEIEKGKIKSVTTNQGLPPVKMCRCRVCGNLLVCADYVHCPFCGSHPEMMATLEADVKHQAKYTADHYIVAMDEPGAKKLVMQNSLAGDKYFNNILNLSQSKILCVNLLYENSNAWEKRFPRKSYWNAVDFMATGFDFLGFTVNWSITQIPHLRQKGVDLIEVQVSNWKAAAGMDYKKLAAAVHRELKHVIPDLPEPSEYYVNHWDNYTGFRPGDEGNRPGIQSPIENLMFIGDWVYAPHHSLFMERTNVMSKFVTNMILEKEGMKEGFLEILPSSMPDWQANIIGFFTDVKV